MKKHITLSTLALMFSAILTAQVISNGVVTNQGLGESVFFDATTNFSEEVGAGSPNVGKGIAFPTVNLVEFEFVTTGLDGIKFPTYFNGMIVYNRATGTTRTDGYRSSTATAVTPGFYYFFNPNGHINQNVTGGVWRPLGVNPSTTNVETHNVASAYTPAATVFSGEKTIIIGFGVTAAAPAILPDLTSSDIGKIAVITNRASTGWQIVYTGIDTVKGTPAGGVYTQVKADGAISFMWTGSAWVMMST